MFVGWWHPARANLQHGGYGLFCRCPLFGACGNMVSGTVDIELARERAPKLACGPIAFQIGNA